MYQIGVNDVGLMLVPIIISLYRYETSRTGRYVGCQSGDCVDAFSMVFRNSSTAQSSRRKVFLLPSLMAQADFALGVNYFRSLLRIACMRLPGSGE